MLLEGDMTRRCRECKFVSGLMGLVDVMPLLDWGDF